MGPQHCLHGRQAYCSPPNYSIRLCASAVASHVHPLVRVRRRGGGGGGLKSRGGVERGRQRDGKGGGEKIGRAAGGERG